MNIRKIVAILLCLCILGGIYNTTYAVDNTSTDVEDTANIDEADTMEVPEESKVDAQTKADILNTLNIISGDGKGNYSLNSQLKRSEAATFIVKMLGMDSYIKENKDKFKTTGFTDVKSSDWFIPYVSYCEQNSIISGIGNNKFGPNEDISEKAFLVLVMKCLGYTSEAGDFSWETVFSNAYRLGLVEDSKYEFKDEDNKDYIREGVVNVLYKGLSLNKKGSSITLLQSLVNDGKIDRDNAFSTGLLNDTLLTAVSKITPQNDSRISVTFNEEVTSISKSNILIYETGKKTKTITVTDIISESQGKLVFGTSKQIADIDYTIEVSNVTDLEGNITKKLISTFKGYKQVEIKSDFFKISKVDNISQNEINVYFTHPINENSEVPAYYQVYENDKLFVEGSSETIKVNLLGGSSNGVTVTIFDKILSPKNEYRIRVLGNLISVYGTNLYGGLGDEASFIPTSVTAEEFTVKSISATNSNTVQLNFSKEVNPVLAKQVYNYNITDTSNNPIQIKQATIVDAYGKSVSLTINGNFNQNEKYNVMVNRLNDIDKKYEIEEKLFTFSGTYPAFVEFNVTSVTPIDRGTIIVNFNKPIDEQSATNIESYSIFEFGSATRSLVPDNIYFSRQNPTQVKLFLKSEKELKNGSDYSVRIYPSFKDYTGATINKYIDYGFVPQNLNSTKPLIARASIISTDTIMVKFWGKEISIDSPNSSAQNYRLEYTKAGENYKKIPIAVTYIDLDTVILKFDALDNAQTYILRCDQIRSYTNQIYKTDDLKCTVSMGS